MINNKKLVDYLAKDNISVVETMKYIDKNAKGIIFIVDDNGKLVGSVSDGDIRRWLIKTGSLGSPVSLAMNCAPKYLHENHQDEAIKIMEAMKIDAIPIVNKEKIVIDIVFNTEKMFFNKITSNNNVKKVPVIIMAGGKGTRLYPYTKILPKPLIPIGDIPIVERIINRFHEFGVENFYMTVNYKKNMIKSYFSELEFDYTIRYIEEDRPLGTAGSINLINEEFSTPVFVTNCDTLIQADYNELYEHHKKSGNVMTIVSAVKNIVVPYGVMKSKENGTLVSIEEKPNLSYLINTGMYILDYTALKKIPKDTFFHMTDLITLLMEEDYQVGIYPISEDSFLDMGEMEEMKRMEEKLNIK